VNGSDLPECPVCRDVTDCEHCLVEWYEWPGERVRGSLVALLERMEDSCERLLVECSRARVRPRHPGLLEPFDLGCAILDESPTDDEDLTYELRGAVLDFVMEIVRRLPGVTEVVVEDRHVRGFGGGRYVSLWAADLVAVRQSLLELLAHLEVQLDQFYFERGEEPPR
jgi:hypothetical protein